MVILSTAARRRRQRLQKLLYGIAKIGALILLLVMTAYAAFVAGTAKNEERVRLMEVELEAAEDEKLSLIAAKETAQERLRRMTGTLAQLEKDYESNVPDGVLAELLGVVEQKLANGLPAERLQFIVEQVGIERVCDSDTETQSLLMRTPLSTALDNTVGFANNRLVVSGEGEPLRDEEGRDIGFFDPAQPIVVRLLLITGEIERIEGSLPMTHSVVIDSDEYQIQMLPDSRRGFLSVTVRRCDYP